MTPSGSSAIRSTPPRRRREEATRRAGQTTSRSSATLLERTSDTATQQVVARTRRLATPAEPWQIAPAGNRSPFYQTVKRTIDVLGTLMMLTLLSPLLLVVTAILLVTTRGRPIFVQERVGFLGRPFRLYKFRTMVVDAEQAARHGRESEGRADLQE